MILRDSSRHFEIPSSGHRFWVRPRTAGWEFESVSLSINVQCTESKVMLRLFFFFFYTIPSLHPYISLKKSQLYSSLFTFFSSRFRHISVKLWDIRGNFDHHIGRHWLHVWYVCTPNYDMRVKIHVYQKHIMDFSKIYQTRFFSHLFWFLRHRQMADTSDQKIRTGNSFCMICPKPFVIWFDRQLSSWNSSAAENISWGYTEYTSDSRIWQEIVKVRASSLALRKF